MSIAQNPLVSSRHNTPRHAIQLMHFGKGISRTCCVAGAVQHARQARAVRRRAAAADRMSASRRCRFRDVFTSRCTPAICC